eukprot:UN06689
MKLLHFNVQSNGLTICPETMESNNLQLIKMSHRHFTFLVTRRPAKFFMLKSLFY